MILPVVLAVFGFFLILIQDDYLDAVLNSTAMLFIIRIDDDLPTILGLDFKSIIHNHLIHEALKEIDADGIKDIRSSSETGKIEGLKRTNEELVLKYRSEIKDKNIDFADIFLTNHSEGGTNITDSRIYTPYEILGDDPEVPLTFASNFVTGNCLIKRIEWGYTRNFPFTTKPRIAFIKLWKMYSCVDTLLYEINMDKGYNIEARRTINIENPHDPVQDPCHSKKMDELIEKYNEKFEKKKLSKEEKDELKEELDKAMPVYRLDGIYMITTLECSESIFRLRICGSKTVDDFTSAIKKYSLWPLDTSARQALQKHKNKSESQRYTQPGDLEEGI
eukprot:CAMPEP_0194160986 /NCGR_PEP_ID=MMETSP0152-20130528/78692_1 /TAXON_ID=1049557 /ORGANISM="Thalassiothrix antarctica, Strain L6-D1" /LENGTH=333 /DNA_ID=CAMNT_0038870731 /DNA_START=1085 /DNA_END=2086 /DNA_ORIENTATION=+